METDLGYSNNRKVFLLYVIVTEWYHPWVTYLQSLQTNVRKAGNKSSL